MHHWHALSDVAWVGDDFVATPIRGLLVSFHGLGGMGRDESPSAEERRLAAHGILHLWPHYGPWSWMNREARAFVDELIEEAYRVHALGDAPLLLRGWSMGGCSALLYARYARRTPAAVMADCPVCDVTDHFTERPDVPRTMYHAFGAYRGARWGDLLMEHSPLHQVDHLPDVPYFITHGDADTAVSKAWHSDRMVAAMCARGLDVEYHELPGGAHCGPLPPDVTARAEAFLVDKLA